MADDLGPETVSLAKASGEGVKCICHNPNFPAHQPLKRLTETTWTTLWNAAETKRDDTWMSIGNLDRETCGEVLYHKACYKWYTNKKTLKKTAVAESVRPVEAVGGDEGSEGDDDDDDDTDDSEPEQRDVEPPKKRTRSSGSQTDLNLCLFCQHLSKRRSGKKEPLTQWISFSASNNIVNAATIRSDSRVLREVSGGDAIAREIKYHRSCLANYTRRSALGPHPLLSSHHAPIAWSSTSNGPTTRLVCGNGHWSHPQTYPASVIMDGG